MSASYSPKPPAMDEKDAAGYAYAELQDVAAALSEAVPFIQLQVLHVEPAKPRDGMLVVADGSDWDPGSGAGLYLYLGSWNFQG